MALAPFPTFAIIRREGFARGTRIDGVGIQTSPSGARYSVDRGAAPQKPLAFTIRATEAEADTLEAFFNERRGRADPFNFTWKGTTYKVCFDQDSLSGEYVQDSEPPLWDYAISLETVP